VAALDGLPLSAADSTTIMGASHMDAEQIYQNLDDQSKSALSNPNCTGAFYNAEQSVYAGSGWSAVRNQYSQQGDASDPNHMVVFQAVVAFSSAEDRRQGRGTEGTCGKRSLSAKGKGKGIENTDPR